MPIVTCSNTECNLDITFNINQLEIDDSQSSGNHTTQYSGHKSVVCESCGSETEVQCVYDELDDTGEILDLNVISH